MSTRSLVSIIVKHLATSHHVDADTLAMTVANGELSRMHHRLHERMLADTGDIFHREGELS